MRTIELLIGCVTKKYATFSGRASRKEFMVWVLIEIVLMLLVAGLYGFSDFFNEPNPAVPLQSLQDDCKTQTEADGTVFLLLSMQYTKLFRI